MTVEGFSVITPSFITVLAVVSVSGLLTADEESADPVRGSKTPAITNNEFSLDDGPFAASYRLLKLRQQQVLRL